MKKLLFVLMFCFLFVPKVSASYDPLSRPNNMYGIHILFPSELEQAAKLVNTSGGDWGYVTIPIQYNDRDIEKWQSFMNDCSRLHLIPIVRIATDPYYANTGVWRKPEAFDVMDFANFLDSITWPTKNRYVVLYNEVNRSDEWGGETPSPEEYADLVSYASDVFKRTNSDFFLISAGLDNAAPNDGVHFMDNFVFLRQMGSHEPDVFSKIDGIASHSYPNPNFSNPPSVRSPEGTSTYKFEQNIVSQFTAEEKPVFITETGWNNTVLPQSVISAYYNQTMKDIWGQDKSIIAVTPFLLSSQNGSFDKLSFIKDNNFTSYAKTYQNLSKSRGGPVLVPITSGSSLANVPKETDVVFAKRSLLSTGLSSLILKAYAKAVFSIGK